MTEKLYYNDAYQKEFSANVLSCEPCDNGFDVVLDKTAFFPEGGGQTSDIGKIAGVAITHVYEKDGVIHHLASESVFGEVFCEIDFARRFDKMQNHTAEHILCGVIHRLYGLDNVGFHLGEEEVVFDISEPLSEEQIKQAEDMANQVVWQNIPIEIKFPKPEELAELNYRSKLELTENVRLVGIGDVDLCACCAPHVKRTGEVGIIKVLEIMRHRGGMRIWIASGARSLRDYRMNKENIASVSASLSVPKEDTAKALLKYMKESDEVRSQLKSARRALAEEKARSIEKTDGNAVVYLSDFGKDELRAFVNVAVMNVGGMLVALSGEEGDYKYIIASESLKLTDYIKDINSALSGRGGGKPNAVQGSFAAKLEDVKKYFEK